VKRAPAKDSVVALLEVMQPGTVIFPAFVDLAPGGRRLGLATGVLLSRAYWLAQKRGEEWESDSADWMQGTGLTSDQLTDALKRLEVAGLLSRYRVGIRKRMRYRLDLSKLAKLLTNSVPVTGKSGYGKPENPVTGNRKIRSRVYIDSPISKEIGRGRKSRSAAHYDPAPPVDFSLKKEAAAGPIGTTWESWEAYGREQSPAWVESGDCRDCWDDMVSAGWRDSGRRIVRDWEAKARRYLRTWRKEGGEAKEKKRAAQDHSTAQAAAQAQKRTEAGRAWMAQAQAAADSQDWPALRKVEAAWMASDPQQFEFYRSAKRPAAWAKELAALAQKRARVA